MKIYNTLSRKVEPFIPSEGKKVNMFVCGPTVYDFIHVGNARAFFVFDVIAKYVRSRGYEIFYLQNITDIDDKIIKRANEEGRSSEDVAREFTKHYLNDIKRLRVDSVDKYAPATDYVNEIISQIERLEEKGHTYETDDGVYFDILSFDEYGKLSRQNLEELKFHRIEEKEQKKNPGDFVIWKKHKPGEPLWESQWGKGRPGWHIEDTAITEKEFGPQYDIHGGGIDLIFPHHEAEIALMESSSGKKPFVRCWMHNGHLMMGEKMSKSLGNVLSLHEALKKWSPENLRYFFLTGHYRQPIHFSEENIESAENSRKKIQAFYDNLDFLSDKVKDGKMSLEKKSAVNAFEDAMDEDFNVSKALAVIFDFMAEFNRLDVTRPDIEEARAFIDHIDGIFCILIREETPKEILDLVNERESARKSRNWKRADSIRDEITIRGYIVEDTPQGPLVRK